MAVAPLIAGVLGCGSPAAPEVLIVTVDTLRADRLGYAGHAAARTPNLDALAGEGRAFLGATTPFPRTTPALASMLTGLWPHHHGSREVGEPLTHGTTLASALAGAGWRTAGFSATPVAGPDQHLDQGFDTFEVLPDARAAEVVERALAVVGQEPDRPLLLWVHVADPHFPYVPPEDGPENPPARRCRRLGEAASSRRARRDAIFDDRDGRSSAALDDCRALYDAEIAAVDAAVGTLLAGWRRARGTDGWVVFTADHGENQGEDGLWYEHGPSLDDAALRVPLVVAGPRVVPGTDDGVARLEDLAPTLLAALGVPAPGPMDGADLGPRLRGEPGGPTVALAESGSALHAGMTRFLVAGRRQRWCVHAEPWSLCTDHGARTLHDRRVDPDLAVDVAAQHPDVVAALDRVAATWPPETARQRAARDAGFELLGRPRPEGGRSWTLRDLHGDPAVDVSAAHPDELATLRAALDAWDLPDPRGTDPDPRTVEALRALGYVEADPATAAPTPEVAP